jgi:aminoglycoside/choline kinase family phosphotransferase
MIELLQQVGANDDPLLRRWFPAPVVVAVLRLWEHKERVFTRLDSMPQTLCHHDVWRNNLFVRQVADGAAQTVAIDWECVGIGAPGEDAGNLVGVSLLNFDVDVADAPLLAETVLAAYLQGQHDAGWCGDPDAIMVAFDAAAVLRSIFSAAGWPVAIMRNSSRYVDETERRWERPIEQIFEHWAGVTAFLVQRAEQAFRHSF